MTVDLTSPCATDVSEATAGFSELDSLLSTLQASIGAFKSELRAHGLPPPSSRKSHPLDTGDWPSHKIYEAKRTIIATLGVLNNIFVTPFEKLTEMTHRVAETASLHLIARLGIPDLLGPVTDSSETEGIRIDKLAHLADIPEPKLAGPLRLLTASGWFEEVEEDVFRNTKMSSQLRNGSGAYCWVRSNEFSARSVCGLAEAATKPAWRQSLNPLHAGCQIGHRSEKHMFELMRSVPNQVYHFTHAVQALEDTVIGPIVKDFPWESLPMNTTIVDVGGGNGGLCLALAKHHSASGLRFIIQDLPDTIKNTNLHIEEVFPYTVNVMNNNHTMDRGSSLNDSGIINIDGTVTPPRSDGTITPPFELEEVLRVTAEPHDFFMNQPRRGDGYSYCLKWVLHNWPDEACVNILSNLAEAAGPKSRILIIDNLVTPCTLRTTPTNGGADETDLATDLDLMKDAAIYQPISPPPYLPQNFGQAGKYPLQLSVFMTAGLNASERTLKQFQLLFDRAGLRLVKVHSLRTWVSIMELEKK